jgi:hypothetical protein
MTGALRLGVAGPTPLALDDVLVVVITLHNDGPVPSTTGTGLSVASDLAVQVDGEDGAVRVEWPWPVDLAPPQVQLAPSATLGAGVLLVWSGRPLFSRPGQYGISCTFRPQPMDEVPAERFVVTRTAAAAPGPAAALATAEVARSLVAAEVLDGAAPGLAALLDGGGPHARLLAAVALGDLGVIPGTAAALAAAHGPLQVAAAVSAVLPGGRDERLTAVRSAVAGHEAALAMLAGVPYPG